MVGCFVWIIFIKKVIAVILCAYHIPKASCRKTVIRIHFILKTSLITIHFFQKIYYSYITLNCILLFGCSNTFFRFNRLIFNLLLLIFFPIYCSLGKLWSSSSSRTTRRSIWTFRIVMFVDLTWIIFWNLLLFMIVLVRILRARLTHWIIKIFYQIKKIIIRGFFISSLNFIICPAKPISPAL